MANTNYAFGLRPVRSGVGGTLRTNNYPILNSYNTNIYYGDVVTLSSAGAVNVSTNTSPGAGVVLGVFLGCFYTDTSLFGQPRFSMYWNAPGSTVASLNDAYAIVADDPYGRFYIGADSTGTNTQMSQLSTGSNAAFATYAAGSTRNGISAVQLSGTTIANTTTLPLRITGYKNAPDNVLPITAVSGGANAVWEVMFNPGIHFYTQATGL